MLPTQIRASAGGGVVAQGGNFELGVHSTKPLENDRLRQCESASIVFRAAHAERQQFFQQDGHLLAVCAQE